MVVNQAQLFLIFILNGIIIGLLFDFFRILRKSFKTNDFITYVEDVVFWILTGILILYSIFFFNNGEIRLFIFVAIGIGIISYMFLFSSYIIKISVKIINVVKIIIQKIFKFLFIPIKYIFKLIRKIFFKPISFMAINIRKNSTIFFKKSMSKYLKNAKKAKILQKN